MIPQPGSSRPKALSLVFTFLEQLHTRDDAFGGPGPDFGNWAETHLFADVATARDNALVEDLSEGERYAWRVFAEAQEATGELMKLYRNHPTQFRKLARSFPFCPA
jgi:hypothetical protein